MYKSDWFILIFTFLVGACAGVFLYLSSVVPMYGTTGGVAHSELEAADLSIIGRTYGGTHPPDYIPASFRIAGDGTYTYIAGSTDSEIAPETGTLPRTLWRDLQAALRSADIGALAERKRKETCRLAYDGVAYTYQVIFQGRGYTLDTCESALPYEHPLARILADTWAYFEGAPYEPRRTYGGSGVGLGELIEARIRGSFQGDSN